MGLVVTYGVLAGAGSADNETLAHCMQDFACINALLSEHGLPMHNEPMSLPPVEDRSLLDGFPYSFLHYLRRAYAHRAADPDWIAQPLPEGADPCHDPVVEAEYARPRSHLIYHSDAEGYYVPIDFVPILDGTVAQVPGQFLGSSFRLMEELQLVAPAININLVNGDISADQITDIDRESDNQEGVWTERIVWLTMFEAARLSIEHNTAIYFN